MKMLTIVGARPQFVKAATVSRAVLAFNAERRDGGRIQEVLVHTGQHYDAEMSDVFFQELELPSPAYHLGVGSGPHGQQTGRMLEALESVMEKEKPDCVVVYGDTNSTLAGGLAAGKLHIPVAHVEAGLRSFNRAMPEEINRVLVDHLSALLFCPTAHAVKNLSCEGIVNGVHLVGDVMAEALQLSLPVARRQSRVLDRLALRPKQYCLATVHRAGNTDNRENLEQILSALISLERPVLFPCHPRTRKTIAQFGFDSLLDGSFVRLIEPVGYLDMLRLEVDAAVIITDSGGVQKEAYWLGIPSVTVREETEWVETVESGWNVLAGADRSRIVAAVRAGFEVPSSRSRIARCDGQASREIVRTLADHTIMRAGA